MYKSGTLRIRFARNKIYNIIPAPNAFRSNLENLWERKAKKYKRIYSQSAETLHQPRGYLWWGKAPMSLGDIFGILSPHVCIVTSYCVRQFKSLFSVKIKIKQYFFLHLLTFSSWMISKRWILVTKHWEPFTIFSPLSNVTEIRLCTCKTHVCLLADWSSFAWCHERMSSNEWIFSLIQLASPLS